MIKTQHFIYKCNIYYIFYVYSIHCAMLPLGQQSFENNRIKRFNQFVWIINSNTWLLYRIKCNKTMIHLWVCCRCFCFSDKFHSPYCRECTLFFPHLYLFECSTFNILQLRFFFSLLLLWMSLCLIFARYASLKYSDVIVSSKCDI